MDGASIYESMPFPGLLADLVLLVHASIVIFVILGQLLFHRIDTGSFMRLLHGILIVTGAYLFLGGLLSL